MQRWLLILATQIPFLLYLALVPPERRAVPRRLGAAVIGTIALGCAGWGAWQLRSGDSGQGRVWLGLSALGVALAAARLKGWVGPRDADD